VLSIGIQSAAANPKFGNIGKWCIVVALIIQLLSFGLFGLTALIFHMRVRKAPTPKSDQVDKSWISTMHLLYGVSALIIFRSIFRIVEYVMGTNGYPLTHEWTLYVLTQCLCCSSLYCFLCGIHATFHGRNLPIFSLRVECRTRPCWEQQQRFVEGLLGLNGMSARDRNVGRVR
jgi:hypothetical protein